MYKKIDMGKIYYEIGETFNHEGTSLQVVEDVNNEICSSCFFCNETACVQQMCAKQERKDSKDVILKKEENT